MKAPEPYRPQPILNSHGAVIAQLRVAPSEAPLSHLVAGGDTKGMMGLLATGDIGSEDLKNALMIACTIGQNEPLQVLIAHGVDVNARTLDGRLALGRAAHDRRLDKVMMLLDAGADPNAVFHSVPLLQSLCHQADCFEVVALLIERGADVHARNDKGWQALHVAAAQWRPELTVTLLRAGADPNATDDEGRTPIRIAASNAQAENVQLLLDAGATVPDLLEQESFWEGVREVHEEDLGDREAAARKITELQRIVRSAVLARDLKAAMANDGPEPGPRRSSGPSPL